MNFSVVTYNVLADAYVKRERYPLSPPEALRSKARRALLLSTLAALDADVLCLQELEPDLLREVEALGYSGIYVAKPGKPDGSAVLVRGPIRVVSSRAVHYRAVEAGYPHVAAIAELELGSRRLHAASTHLRWQRRDTPPDRHLGRLQLLELLAHRDEGAWLVAGDFNTLSEGPVIREALAAGLRLSCRSQRPWDTVNIDGRRRKLDYLLYTPAHLRAIPGTLPRLERRTPMPSAVHASDHLPVRVDYEWCG